MALDGNTVKTYLLQSIHPNRETRRVATEKLLSFQTDPNSNFCQLLLKIIQGQQEHGTGGNEATAQHAAAIYFKNYVKKGWDSSEATTEVQISDADKAIVKQHIVSLMCEVPKNLMSQLTEAVRIIGEHDFPDAWGNLLPDIKSKLFSTQDFRIINGMLETLNTLFKMFRDKEASDPLWLKLKYVLEQLQQDLLRFFLKVCEIAEAAFSSTEPSAKKLSVELLSCTRLLCRIYYSLNWQTIPEFFEDNIQVYMSKFHFFLCQNDYGNATYGKCFETKEARVMMIRIQSAIIGNLKIYAEKYDEEFQPFLQQFTQDTWTLLTNCKEDEEYTEVVTSGLGFLSVLVSKTMNKSLFSGQGVLQSICEKIIIPNLMVKEYDVENFEFNPLDYIRGDLEGGDKISRRKTTIELLRSISKNFESEITGIALSVLNNAFQLQAADAASNSVVSKLTSVSNQAELEGTVRNYDVSTTLFIAVAAKRYTFGGGVSEVNEQMNLQGFFGTVIVPILQLYQEKLHREDFAENTVLNLLISDCLKFIIVFRKQLQQFFLPSGQSFSLLQILTAYLKSQNFVVCSYAAIALERVLSLKAEGSRSARFAFEDIQAGLGDLLTNLFAIIENGLSSENEYNEYAMKTIMRVISVSSVGIADHKEVMLEKLCAILMKICPNPQNPTFNHYLFECLAAVVASSFQKCQNDGNIQGMIQAFNLFEAKLFPLFQQILSQDVTELTPFVFQIMAQLLEANEVTKREISPGYLSLFPALLAPVLWQNKGNNPVLVRLLNAYLRQNNLGGKSQIISESNAENLKGLLGIFQKLMSITSTEVYGLRLLTSILLFVSPGLYSEFLATVFQIIFTKFQTKKSDINSKRQYCVFFAVLIRKLGSEKVFQVLDGMQQGLFFQSLMQIYTPTLERMNEKISRKATIAGTSLVLTEIPGLIRGDPGNQTVGLNGKKVFLALLTMMAKATKREDNIQEDLEEVLASLEETGYSSSFSKLVYSQEKLLDPFKDIEDGELFFAKQLGAYSKQHPGVVQPFIVQSIQGHPQQEKLQAAISSYLQRAGVALS